MSSLAHNALLVLEDNIDSGPIEQALPPGSRVTKTALPDAAYLWSSLTATAADVDLVVFACDREHDRVARGDHEPDPAAREPAGARRAPHGQLRTASWSRPSARAPTT